MLRTKYKIMYMNRKVLKVYTVYEEVGLSSSQKHFNFFYIVWVFIKEMDLCMIDMMQNSLLKLQTFGVV